MLEIELPKGIVKSISRDPKLLILYSIPKIGKTTLLSKLPDSLLIDLEDGSDFVDAVKVKVNNLKELKEVGTAIMKAKRPYKKQTGRKQHDNCRIEGRRNTTFCKVSYFRLKKRFYFFNGFEKYCSYGP